ISIVTCHAPLLLCETVVAERGLRATKRVARIASDRLQPILDHFFFFELVEEMRTALQVEAEINLLVRKPRRQSRQGRWRKQIRERKQEAHEHDAPNEDHLPSLKMQHGCLKLRLNYGANRLA